MLKAIYDKGETYEKEVANSYKRFSLNPMEVLKKVMKHMDQCQVRISQRIFETFPKLKRFIKVNRHGVANVYHIRWRNIQFEVQRVM